MINVFFYFIDLYNLFLFLLLFAGSSAWVYYCITRGRKDLLVPPLVFSVALILMWWRIAPIGHDELEHLHCSWMVYSGLTPFKDFWQHHAPLFWIVCAPAFKFLKPSGFVFELARVFSAFLAVIAVYVGWKIARRVWQGEARFSMYMLIVFASSSMAEFLRLRPDLFMIIFLLLCVYLCLGIPGKRVSPSFFAGVSFGIAASFIFKQYLIFLLAPLVIMKAGGRLRFAKLSVYFLGFCLGVFPLALYLVRTGTVGDFIYWVYDFNRMRLVFAAMIPVAVGCIGVWGACVLLRRYRESGDHKAFVILAAFCLSTASSLKHTFVEYECAYSLAFWLLLCAIAAAGIPLPGIGLKNLSPRWRSIIAGSFLSILFFVNVTSLEREEKNLSFTHTKEIMVELSKYAAGDSCLTLLPYHPVFCRDATRLYSYWQFSLITRFPKLRSDVTDRDMGGQILAARPAVVQFSHTGRNFLLELFQKRLITGNDFKRIMTLLQKDYTLKWIGTNRYYVRKDKLEDRRQ
ncbi:MAG: hypothetical protein PHR11_00670 [Candidatus Omnitrophica bacterium]|nr:hypothetical protein [Candidatus Omnitrophota bacterium]